MIWERMLEGMAAAAWLVGFVMIAGLMAAFLYLICTLMKWAFGNDDDDGEGAGEDGDDAEAVADGRSGGLNAEAVGRHLRRSAGSDD